MTSAVNGPKKFAIARCLFEQLSKILKHGVFFVRSRAIGEKELLAQVPMLVLSLQRYRACPLSKQELISVLSRSPCPLRWFGMLTAEVAEITEFEPKKC